MKTIAALLLTLCLSATGPGCGQRAGGGATPDLPRPSPGPAAPSLPLGPAEPPRTIAKASPILQRSAVDVLDGLLLFHPAKATEGDWQPSGLRFEEARFEAADGTRLHGWYCPAEGARAVLLYAHGNGGNVSRLAPLLASLQGDLKVTTLAFDYRGYGRSEGTPTADGILQDARAARTFLARRAGVDPSAIVLMGRSLGGAVVVQLAAEDRPRGLILESTFSSLREVADFHFPRLAPLVPPGKLDSTARIADYAGPLLQTHGDADRTIPFASGKKLHAAAPGPKRFIRIAGGDHNDPQSAEAVRALRQFLDDLPAP